MNTRFSFVFGFASLGVTAAILTWLAGSASAAPEKVQARTRLANPGVDATTNAVPASAFFIPTNKVAGRDPFFPDCDCGKIVVKVDPTTPTAPSVSLVFNGRSGTVEKALAIINGRTFERGESGDVTSPNGGAKVSIRVIEIKESSVVVEIGGKQQQELFLRGK